MNKIGLKILVVDRIRAGWFPMKPLFLIILNLYFILRIYARQYLICFFLILCYNNYERSLLMTWVISTYATATAFQIFLTHVQERTESGFYSLIRKRGLKWIS